MRLTSTTRCQSARLIVSGGPTTAVPALLTRMSSVPKRSTVCAIMAATAASSVTSAERARLWHPIAPKRCAVSCTRSSRRPTQTTEAPASASASAKTTPSPEPAPVTRATRPDRSKSCATVGMISRAASPGTWPAAIGSPACWPMGTALLVMWTLLQIRGTHHRARRVQGHWPARAARERPRLGRACRRRCRGASGGRRPARASS